MHIEEQKIFEPSLKRGNNLFLASRFAVLAKE